MFPASAIFNTRIDDATRFPVHASNAAWKSLVGASKPLFANWGWTSDPSSADFYGLPVNVVDGTSATTHWSLVGFDFNVSGLGSTETGWPEGSDCAVSANGGWSIARDCSTVPSASRRFPFPATNTVAEGGTCSGPGTCGDHHVLVVERGTCRLWEAYRAFPAGTQWYALATAAWDLTSNAMRPDGWSSADAAGLPITPLLARASEASTGEIHHALRVTFQDAALAVQHVWPARFASGGDNPGAIPFGALLRLRADFVIPDTWSTQAKAVALAAKRYGLYVSDNGADFYVQGEPSSAWESGVWSQLKGVTMTDMEFVDLSAVTGDARFSKDSFAASW